MEEEIKEKARGEEWEDNEELTECLKSSKEMLEIKCQINSLTIS